MPAPKQTKLYRDPLSPKPILDRSAFLRALESSGILLKDGQLDLFYQQLHRSGYPPLKEFAAELQGREVTSDVGDSGKDDDGIARVAVVGDAAARNFRTKNPISSRLGRRPKLPKSLLSYLATTDEFATQTSMIQTLRTSADGSTTKLAVELQDGHVVESVLMRHGRSRVTICVSSQVGCAMGCTFCATGTMGIRGNLSSGEILEQLVHGSRILAGSYGEKGTGDEGLVGGLVGLEAAAEVVVKGKRTRAKRNHLHLIRNVVFMGMGEPLNNYHNVLAACRAIINRRTWNLAHSRVTVSTVGVLSKMRALTRDLPEVNMALSLHAPNQMMRERIVPAARGTPIKSLIEALDEHMMALSTKRRRALDNPQGSDRYGGSAVAAVDVMEFNREERQSASKKKRAMIEYVMLEGNTSTIEAAHQLGSLCEGRHLVVNLIPYNKTDVQDELSCPSEGCMQEFRRVVSSYGSFCSIRRTMGVDIAGACGQLTVGRKWEDRLQGLADIEDSPFSSDGDGRGRRRGLVPTIIFSKHVKKRDGDETKNEANYDPWIQHLTIATTAATACFVVSSVLLILQRTKK